MKKTNTSANITNKKTTPNVECTPIQAIKKPLDNDPKTAAPFQVLLLQVAALGYIFLGTNRAINEKIVGPKKDLRTPPKNTKPYILNKIVFVSQDDSIVSEVNQNRPKLIKENNAIHIANKFRFSF